MLTTPSFADTLASLVDQHQQGTLPATAVLELVGQALSKVPDAELENASLDVVKTLGQWHLEFSDHHHEKATPTFQQTFIAEVMGDVAKHAGRVDLEEMAAIALFSKTQVKAILAASSTQAGRDALEQEPAFKVLLKQAKSFDKLNRGFEDNDELRYNEDKADRHLDRIERQRAAIGTALADLPSSVQPEAIRFLHGFIQDLETKTAGRGYQPQLDAKAASLRTTRRLSIDSAQAILLAMAAQKDTHTETRRRACVSGLSRDTVVPETPSVKKRAPRH